MTFIHERPEWPEFTWDSEALSPMLAALRYREGQLLGGMQALGFELRTEASLRTLTDDVVKSSAIEGEKLDPEEVRSSIARRLGLDAGGLVPASRDVEGVVEMMLDATQHHDRGLTAERLFGWHASLFPTGRSGMRRIAVGAWRPAEAGPMQVVSGPVGRETIHFEAPAADRLETEMARFLDWFNSPPTIDPVLKAAVAHFRFVTIHPFEDGNGRIARAIADMALARADGSKERYYSMSSQIEAEREAYYERLERQQRDDLDITGWLTWFLGCLDRAIDRAGDTLAAVLYKARLWEKANRLPSPKRSPGFAQAGRPVNERQRLVLDRMLNGFQGHMNTSKYAELARCSTDTALRDIRNLRDRGILIRNPGGGRSTSYRLASSEELE